MGSGESVKQLFKGKKVVVATMHKKEEVIGPLFFDAFGVNCTVINGLDTDKFGTFTGEKERLSDPLTTARNKCILAAERTGASIVIASEGSFGSHPQIPYVPADDEIVLLKDFDNNLEIFGRKISLETNYYGSYVHNLNELSDFTSKVDFPNHALIIKDHDQNFTNVIKGISSWDALHDHYKEFIDKDLAVYLETDMRALYNPTRMKVIADATKNLIEKLNSICPSCDMPGFAIKNVQKGLPCECCGALTNGILSLNYVCSKCEFKLEKPYPNNKEKESAMYCDFCNP